VVQSYTDPPQNLIGYAPWYVREDAGWAEHPVLEHRPHKQGFVVRFAGIDDRTAAERLRGRAIAIDAALLPPPAEDEYYWKDLIGLDVLDPAGRWLGKVAGLMDTPGHDVLVVQGTGAADVLIPFVRQIVIEVDLQAGRVVADWDPGY
jgi:16S rRNA processing protein RimM